MEKNIFDVYPEQVEDLINFAQFEKTLEVPTENGAVPISLSLLWEGEIATITRKSADYVTNPADMMSRTNYIKLETLVYSISKIGEMSFRSLTQDPDEEKILRDKLRLVLSKCSPQMVQYLYDCYTSLVAHRDVFVNEATESFKKKFQEGLLGQIPQI